MKKILLIIPCLLIVLWAQAQEKRAGYYDNGKLKYEGHIDGEKKMGEWTYYFDNGQKMKKGVYKDGVPYGNWESWFRNGTLKEEGGYAILNGKPVKHGEWVTYHKNGSKATEGKYVKGKPVGTWYEYNTLGVVVHKKNL